MHDGALAHMGGLLERATGSGLYCLDVGSLDVNGTFRPLVEGRGWHYTGLDIEPGPNVDIFTDDPYKFPIGPDAYDVVISGSTMEHVEAIWLWLPELVRVLRPGGLLAIVTHWQIIEHRYPVDFWRILPDGMRFLFDRTEQLSKYDIRIVSGTDIVGSAIKWAN